MTNDADPVPRDVSRAVMGFKLPLAAIHMKAQRTLLELTFDPKQTEGANKNTCRERLEKFGRLCDFYRTTSAAYQCDEQSYLVKNKFCDAVWTRGGRFRERMGIRTFINSRAGANDRIGSLAGASCGSWEECTNTCAFT